MSRRATARMILVTAFLAAALLPALPGAPAAGSGFGVSPVDLAFDGLLRGESYARELRLQNNFAEDLVVVATPRGDVATWTTTSPASPFTVPAGEAKIVTVTLTVPEDAANGDYAGGLRLQAASGRAPEGSGSAVNMELVPTIHASVGGDQRVAFSLEGARALDSEESKPVRFMVDIINLGNVRGAPDVVVVAVDADGKEALRATVASATVPAGGHATQALQTPGGLPVGEYVARVALASGGPAREGLAFKVVPAGNLALSDGKAGEIAAIDVDDGARAGLPVKIAAVFRNTGAKDVLAAKATYEILRDGTRVAVLTSDPLVVPAGRDGALEAYWTPTAPGTYTIHATVAYDGLKTAAKTATLPVAGDGAGGDAAGAAEGASPAAKTPALGALGIGAGAAAAAFARRQRL